MQADRYLLTCMRYIELNPVAAGMVDSPEQYQWSSYRNNAWGETLDFITKHDLYLQLGRSPSQRLRAYRNLFEAHISDSELHEILECLAFNYLLGNDRFREQMERALGRRVGHRQRGRPVVSGDAPK